MRKVNLNILLAVCVLMITFSLTADADTHYVGPGQSIQDVIDNQAGNGDQIEVAPGTYTEAINFMGLAIRVYSSGGPDVTTIDGDGALHTILCRFGEGADTILEGFTITGGNANGADYSGKGGGMLNRDGSSPTVIDCIFSGNSAVYGSGMCNTDGSSPTVTDCTFSGNSGGISGGGIYNDNSSPSVTNCSFVTNTAADAGGGMYNNNSSSPTVTECTFSNNTGTNSGGGMYNNSSGPTVSECTFSNNTCTFSVGGGMYNNNSSPTVTDCTFSNNTGNGMSNLISSPTVTNCTFSNNTFGGNGGGMYNQSSSLTLTNCTFSGNSAGMNGGGMYIYNSSATLTNCTFSSNVAAAMGGGVRNWDSSPTVTNCIVWGNLPDQISSAGTSSPVVSYSDVQGGYTGAGNIDADPLFLDAAVGDLRLTSSGSPCVDTGDNSVVTEPNDLAGNPRVVDGNWDSIAVVDMGAYELQPKQIHNITQDTWYETIQLAIDDADSADQIEVGPDTYNEAINFNGQAIELYSSDGPEVTTIDGLGAYHVVLCVNSEGPDTVLEGFTITGGNANGPSPADRDGAGMYNNGSSPTITNCIFKDNRADHGGGMLNVDCSPTLTGCTFQNNTAWGTIGGGGLYNHNSSPIVTECTFSDNSATNQGGGMCNYSSSNPIVTDCTFSDNTASDLGGGMYNYASSPTVTDCIFSDNTADNIGGGMCNHFSGNPMLMNCTFTYNMATNSGGGMFNYDCSPMVTNCDFNSNSAIYGGGMYNNGSPTVTNCSFSGNSADHGGGMLNENLSTTLTNCTFSGNSVVYWGGGIYNKNSSPTMTNCTFSGNSADNGGGMFNDASSPTVTNCILWADTPSEISGSFATVSYSDVQGGYTGTGNIDADPNFVDADNPDPNLVNLRLMLVSPCIDAGDSTPLLNEGISQDLDGLMRFSDIDAIPDTGVGLFAFTDMGAYEFSCDYIPGDINCDGVVDFKDFAIMAENWLVGAIH